MNYQWSYHTLYQKIICILNTTEIENPKTVNNRSATKNSHKDTIEFFIKKVYPNLTDKEVAIISNI